MSTWSGQRRNNGKRQARNKAAGGGEPTRGNLSGLVPPPKLFPWIAGVAAFFLYLATLCPTVWWISSGEFIASAEVLGIPHAPGDSPYVLTARLLTLLFPHCPDWGVNLLSAVSAAFAVGALAALCPVDPKREKASHGASLLAAAFFAGSLCLWTQATVGERRSFLLALLAGSLWAFKGYLETHRVRGMLLGFFLLGIASAIRPNALVFALVVSVFIALRAGRIQPPLGSGTWARSLLFFLVGFSASLYLPLRSPHAPFSFLTFGADRFIPWIKEISGLSFLGHTHPALPVSLWGQLPRFTWALGLEFGPLGFLAALVGLASLKKARSPVYGLYLLFLLTDIVTWVPFRPFGQGIQHYALFSFFLMGPFMALGIIEGMALLREQFSQKVVLAALMAGVFLNGWNHWRESDRSRDFSAGDYASSCFSLSQGASALFFDSDNEYFALLPGYFHNHQGPRQLVYAPIYEAMNHVSWVAALPDALKEGPVYTAFRDDQLAQRILLVPEGPLYRVSPFLSPVKVEAEARGGQGAFAEFENGVRLRGSILGGEYLGSSRLFGLDLAWSALKRKTPGFWVGVYLSDSRGRFRFLDAFQPALGLVPTGQWNPGKAFHERKILLLPWDLPAGDWRVNIGLYPASSVNLQASAPPGPNDTLYSETNPFSQRYQGSAGILGKFQSVLLSKGAEPGNFILPVGQGSVPVVTLGNSFLHVQQDLPLFPLGPRVRGLVTLLPAPPQGGA